MDLGYHNAQAAVTSNSLSVSFLALRGTDKDTVLEVSVTTTGLALALKSAIDLTENSPDSQNQRGTITRNVFGDPHQTFPPLERGELVLDQVDQNPDGTKLLLGSFHATFQPGADFGAGRNVYGDFRAQVGP